MHTFAHHENVAEKVAAALEISTYYGKTASERKRNRIIQDFRDGDMLPAFMVANDMEIELDLPAALYVVYLEMPRSFSKCENVLNRVSGDNTEKLVSMYFLASENFLDKRSQYRLQIREKEYDALMDGVTTK